MDPIRERPVLDVSGLLTVMFGKANTTWLANLLYMMIDGTFFALVVASYFYLRTRSSSWPPGNLPPTLAWGITSGAIFLISLVPARYAQRVAPSGDRSKIRWGLLALAGVAVTARRVWGLHRAKLNCA